MKTPSYPTRIAAIAASDPGLVRIVAPQQYFAMHRHASDLFMG
jgi:hypothetical protein